MARARPPEWVLCLVTTTKGRLESFAPEVLSDLQVPKHSLALYAGESGVSPTGDKGQRYSWI